MSYFDDWEDYRSGRDSFRWSTPHREPTAAEVAAHAALKEARRVIHRRFRHAPECPALRPPNTTCTCGATAYRQAGIAAFRLGSSEPGTG